MVSFSPVASHTVRISSILTGGIAYSKDFVDYIKGMVEYIAPVTIYPGEDELPALAQHGIMVLNGEEEVKVYK